MPTGVYQHKRGYKRPPFSEKWREKISNAIRGKILPEETKKKISLALKNRVFSDEHRKKISDARKGMIFTSEHRRNISSGHKGIVMSLETKRKQSERMKGHPGYNLGKKTPLEVRKKISDSLKKIKPAIKTSMNKLIRGSLEYRLWREAVFGRDNWTCVWCGARNGSGKKVILHPDHIKPFALFPELRFAIDNGRTLCIGCHKTTDTYGYRTRKLLDTLPTASNEK